jgi:uncharacterized protein Yka (UPF0111/DUF47 family)
VDTYERRFAALCDRLTVRDDTVPAGYVESVTRADRNGTDSLHLLIMDLHRELNHLQSCLAEQTLDGARAYALADADEPLVRAFMRGVNQTAPLKFNHPGLGTTATRAGGRLVIQNDIGTTDAHVLVIHVTDLELSFVYTDIHKPRLRFFRELFDEVGLTWDEQRSGTGTEYETCVGRRLCGNPEELRQLLAFVGSRLVFLIDWNRARKRLSRFAKKSDAVAALRWAADHGYGHRGFLEAGGERLVYHALERTAAPQLRYGARLDEALGRPAAIAFLQSLLRITSEALQQRRSLRLVRDEVQAELARHLQDSEQGMLVLVADHAALVVALAIALRDALLHLRSDAAGTHLPSLAERAKRWETKADDIVNRVRHAERHLPDSKAVAPLLAEADDVADGLEEVIFLMTLLREHSPGPQAVETLEDLAKLAALSAEEYVKCVDLARAIRRSGTRDDVQQFLIAVDRVITLEHESDETERRAKGQMLKATDSFRALHLLSQIARGLEESVDALARCTLSLKDSVMSDMLVE